jgi:hypothetical protein
MWKSIKPIPTFTPPRRLRRDEDLPEPDRLRDTHSEGKVTLLCVDLQKSLRLIAAWINMWFGISKAGHSVKDEAPVSLLASPRFSQSSSWLKASYP